MQRVSLVLLIFPLLLFFGLAIAEDGSERVAVGEFFAGGKVERFKARRITITYDLSRESALQDFDVVNPFLVLASGGFEVSDGALQAEGSNALVFKGVFEADVSVDMTLTSETPRDLGLVLLTPGLTDQFLLFSLADTFFSKKDRQKPLQHMITVVGARDGGGSGESLFRYLKRSRTPTLKEGAEIKVRLLKRAGRNQLSFAGKTLSATDRYGKFPRVRPGLFVLRSKMTVTELSISGRLTEAFLNENRIEFDPEEVDEQALPLEEAPAAGAESEEEPDRGGPPRGGRRDESDARGLVRKLRDKRLSDDEREEAAKGLSRKNVKKDELKALIDCLYSDDLTTRKLAILALKKATGKTLGYNPKASEEARKKAVRNWFRYLMQNRDRYR